MVIVAETVMILVAAVSGRLADKWERKAAGFNASFWGLSIVAAVGGALYQFFMPETKDQSGDAAGS